MRILMLGGTGFVGRHITEAALDAGHDVTIFNRGQTNSDLFPDARRLTGDRSTGDLGALRTGEWDAVVDVNAYVPRVVREAAAALEGQVGHYTYISTVSVYQQQPRGPVDEDAPLVTLEDPTTEERTGATYGGLKVLCEQVAQEAFPGRCTVVRPGIVAGPYDTTDRFTYWVRRVAEGGDVLVPDRPDQPVQVVHARDQGDFVVKVTAERVDGVFNSVGPSQPLTLAAMIEACAEAAGTSPAVHWIPEEVCAEQSLPFPLYLPSQRNVDGLFEVSPARAEAAGLRNRPIVDTAADTLAWDRTRDQATMASGTLSREREAEILAAHRA